MSSPSNEGPVIIAGWLGKMRRAPKLLARWNKRWVTIQNETIMWRHSKESEVAAGGIKLEDVDRVYKLKAIKSNRDTVLIVKSKKRNLCLMARSVEDCDRWVRAIQLQLDLREGGTISGPKSQKNRRLSNGGGDKYKKMIEAAQTIESDIPTTIEGSFSAEDLNISDLDATFASSFLGETMHRGIIDGSTT